MKPISLSELLACLYRAPLDATGWQHFMDCLSTLTGAVGGVFLHHNLKESLFEIRAVGGVSANPALQRDYNLHYGPLDPWRDPFLARGGFDVTQGEDLVPLDQLRRTEIYNDFLTVHKIVHPTILPGCRDGDNIENITFWRDAENGPLSRSSVRLLRLLQPHLCTAIQTEHRLAEARLQAASAQAMLDAMHQPAILLDEHLMARHWNRAAECLFLTGGIAVRAGRLRVSPFRQPALDAMLYQSAAQAGASQQQIQGANMGLETLSLERAGRRPLTATAMPLRLESQSPPAHVLVLITDPDVSPSLAVETMRTLYGASPTETMIGNSLMEGLTLAEIARRRRLSEDTVRGHLKTLFRRTGTNRQTELVLLLGSLPRTHRDTRTP